MSSVRSSRWIPGALGLLLAVLFVVPVAAQANGIPDEIEIDTLYEGALAGIAAHTVEVPRAGEWALFLGADLPTHVTATLPGGEVVDHRVDDRSGSFLFLESQRAGAVELLFELVDPGQAANEPSYAFVFTEPQDVQVDEPLTIEPRLAPIASDPGQVLAIQAFRITASFDALVTVRIPNERYDVSIIAGGPDAATSDYGAYDSGPEEGDAVFQFPVLTGGEYGFLVLREPDGVMELTSPMEVLLSNDELVAVQPVELFFGESDLNVLSAGSPEAYGRRAQPYFYEAEAGVPIAVVLESVEFDTYLIVETPGGSVLEDDDGAWERNSLVIFTPTVSGEARIYASSFSGTSGGEFFIQILSPEGADEYIAEYDDWGWDEAETQETAEAYVDDYIASLTTLVPETSAEVEITDESSVYMGDLVEAFDLLVEAPIDIEISLRSDTIDTYLTVVDPDGVEYGDDDGGGGTNSMLRLPVQPGTYRIYAGSYSGWSTGSIVLSVNEYAAGPLADNVQGERMEPGTNYPGMITASSPTYGSSLVEVYEIDLSTGGRLTVDLRSEDIDTYLYVIGPDRTVLRDDDGGSFTDSRITIEDATAGVYRVYASSYGGSEQGAFVVRYEIE